MTVQAPYLITFAGVPGSSKSILAYHLSMAFSLPIFSTDNIRYEVREDFRLPTVNRPHALREYERRQSQRWRAALTRRVSFIRDCSVDRSWPSIKREIETAGFGWFLINMELSRAFMLRLYEGTARPRSASQLDGYLAQHEAFMEVFGADVSLQITDEDFATRTSIAEASLRAFLEQPRRAIAG
jgi:hypothetical protein